MKNTLFFVFHLIAFHKMIDLDIHKSVKNDTISGIILAEYPALLPYGVHKTRLVKRQKKPASYAVFG